MLRSLHVENYVLIDSLDIQFPEGLVIITGQTGAGKSILLGALSLLTGAKADAGIIASGADSCVVEGEFVVEGDKASLQAALEQAEVEWNDGELLIRRVVHASGRSRSFINDSPVSVQLLSELSQQLIDIHSQHQSLALTKSSFQLALLDHFAGNDALRAVCSTQWAALQGVSRELSELRERLARLAAEKEYNQAQWEQLDKARLRAGELEELEEEQKQLANAEQIKENLSLVEQALDCTDRLREARKLLEKTSAFIPAVAELASRLDSSRLEIEDIAADVSSRNASLSISGERLEQVEDRISLLYQLMRKHNVRTVEELVAVRDRYAEALFDSSALELREDELVKAQAAARKAYDDTAAALHKVRVEAAPKLAAEIQSGLRFLELDRAVFLVEVQQIACGALGADNALFLFSSTGSSPVELSRCASGGELSRIMLCLKEMMARYVGMPTMIFDEIDTGVSGSVADKMGRMICTMGEHMQVFAITHLPQVAAKGCAHYVVSKSEDPSGRVVSSIRLLDSEARVQEIARLLSGELITPAALANARELLG